MSSAQSPLDPERKKAPSKFSPTTEGRRAQAYSPLPQVEALPGKKRKSWLVPLVAALCIAGAMGVGSFEYLSHQTPAPVSTSAPVMVQHATQNALTLSGADVDQATTDQAIADIKAGVNSALVAPLSAEMKQQILTGQRKFYALPTSYQDTTQHSDVAPPAVPPAPSADVAPPRQAPQNVEAPSGNRVSVQINGALWGVYDLPQATADLNGVVTMRIPFMVGDRLDVTCVALAPGQSSVIVGIATANGPIQTPPLKLGDDNSWGFGGNSNGQGSGQDYAWYDREAHAGNPVAEYGLAHMYEFGLGVPQDRNQAIYWFQQAAAQNYLDAQAQLNRIRTQ